MADRVQHDMASIGAHVERIPGVDGAAADRDHRGWIPVDSSLHSVVGVRPERDAPVAAGFDSIRVTGPAGAHSALLARAAVDGRVYREMELDSCLLYTAHAADE